MSADEPQCLIVTDKEERLDKNSRRYFYLKIKSLPHKRIRLNGMLYNVRQEVKETAIIAYPVSYLPDGNPQYGHDFKIGDFVLGRFVTRRVDPYTINGRTQFFATVVVLADTSDEHEFEINVFKAFRRHGYTILTEGAEKALFCADSFCASNNL